MKWKSVISLVLVVTLTLVNIHNIFLHHQHNNHHFCEHNHNNSNGFSTDVEEHCDNHTHTSCIICSSDQKAIFSQNQAKLNFSNEIVCYIVQIIKEIEPKEVYNHLYQNDKFHILKSKFERQPHSLRAPPFIV